MHFVFAPIADKSEVTIFDVCEFAMNGLALRSRIAMMHIPGDCFGQAEWHLDRSEEAEQ